MLRTDPTARGGRPSRSSARVVGCLLATLVAFGCGEPEDAGLRALPEEEEASERATRRQAQAAMLAEESLELMPAAIAEVSLGMPIDELRRLRPNVRIDPSMDRADPGTRLYEERLENGARVAYVVATSSERLQRVQVLSQLPDANAIAPHLTAMDERYGTPTGVWDCPDTGGVPTRRFTWRHARTTVSDVFLRYGSRVAVTLYIAPTPVIAASLRRAHCRPATAENLARFPVATPAQMQAGQR